MNSRLLMRILPLAAVAAMVSGIVVVLKATSQPATFGWFAYAPLSEANAGPGLHIVSTGGIVGFTLLAAGLIVLAFWGGLRIGCRRGDDGSKRTTPDWP